MTDKINIDELLRKLDEFINEKCKTEITALYYNKIKIVDCTYEIHVKFEVDIAEVDIENYKLDIEKVLNAIEEGKIEEILIFKGNKNESVIEVQKYGIRYDNLAISLPIDLAILKPYLLKLVKNQMPLYQFVSTITKIIIEIVTEELKKFIARHK